MAQPTIPRGTRDFGPATMAKRQFIFNTIRSVFQKFGFQPLETPAMENLSTLTGKYGDEGDQLLFRILNSGPFLKEFQDEIQLSGTQIRELFDFVNQELGKDKIRPVDELEKIINSVAEKISFRNQTQKRILTRLIVLYSKELAENIQEWFREPNQGNDAIDRFNNFFEKRNFLVSKLQSDLIKDLRDSITEKGLRYDLTVPFARYVVMNRHEISFPFKRYQIQPVWRADKPQKGRYREFYQCDADVVGTDSLICETEIILMIREVFSLLGITDYKIKINHRAILAGIAELVGTKENETSLFVAIDKLDKIGEEKVREELRSKGFKDTDLKVLFDILNFNGSTFQKIEFLTAVFNTPTGKKGVADLNAVLTLLWNYGADDKHLEFDIALARGLSYYTGCIFEVKVNNVAIGSVSGGGRYDNLTQAFGDKENLPGIGISFGVDRLYDVMEELNLFPREVQVSSKVFICHFDEQSMKYGLGLLTKLRRASIAAEIYPDQAKIKKQLDYVNKKMIPYSLVIGSDEVKSGSLALKNMETGIQEMLTIEQIIEKLGE